MIKSNASSNIANRNFEIRTLPSLLLELSLSGTFCNKERFQNPDITGKKTMPRLVGGCDFNIQSVQNPTNADNFPQHNLGFAPKRDHSSQRMII